MKRLNTLLSIVASTILLANVASAQTLEKVKAEPIDLEKLQATVKLQLQNTMALSKVTLSNENISVNTLLVKNSQQGNNKTATLANINYSAE